MCMQPLQFMIICDRILENRRYTHNSTFVIKRIYKLWVKNASSRKKYVRFYCLTGGRIKPPMDKSWASLCSPVHREYKNLCFISIHERIPKLQMFVYVAVTKEFTVDRFSVNLPSFSNTEARLGKKLYFGGCTKSW